MGWGCVGVVLMCPRFQRLFSLKGRDAVLDEAKLWSRTKENVPKAHLEILCAVTPSLRFHRLGKLEDIQSSTFLSTQTGFGDCFFFSFPRT